MSKFKAWIEHCENAPMSLGRWVATALGIIFVRNTVESIVAFGTLPELSAFDLLHVPVFFLSVLIGIVVILHVFSTGFSINNVVASTGSASSSHRIKSSTITNAELSKTDIVKISKLALVCFAVILLPVLLDLILSFFGHPPVVYSYIFQDAGKSFINFFNPWYTIPEIPRSLRLEVGVIVLGTSLYLVVKTGRYLSAIAGGALVFCLCFFYVAMPAIFMALFNDVLYPFLKFLLRVPIAAKLDQRVLVLLELFLTFFWLNVWYRFYDAVKWKALWENVRWTRSAHYFILAVFGFKLGPWTAVSGDLFLLIKMAGILGALFFAFQFSVVINDLVDLRCDQVSNPRRPLTTGAVPQEEYFKVGIVYLFLSLLFALWVSASCFQLILLFVIGYYLYSVPPLRLKRFLPVAPFIIGLQALLAFLIGQVSLLTEGMPFDARMMGLIFCVFSLSAPIKDLKDREGDRQDGVLTLPVWLGEPVARRVIGGFVALSYLLVPVFLSGQLYFTGVVWILAFFFALSNFIYISSLAAKENFIFYLYFLFAGAVLVFLK